uniref:Uncharacterized protein n=1 Tax=Romanomermis culicivorax TaxID=13658 RepID=A0A915JH79_ROMCU
MKRLQHVIVQAKQTDDLSEIQIQARFFLMESKIILILLFLFVNIFSAHVLRSTGREEKVTRDPKPDDVRIEPIKFSFFHKFIKTLLDDPTEKKTWAMNDLALTHI